MKTIEDMFKMMKSMGLTPSTSASSETPDRIDVFSTESRSTGGLGFSPKAAITYLKATGNLHVIGR